MAERYELECMGEPVVMVIGDDVSVTLEGWDDEAEAAARALGFEPSLCSKIADVLDIIDAAEDTSLIRQEILDECLCLPPRLAAMVLEPALLTRPAA